MTLKQIKTQLKSTQALQRILGAMELTSSIKLQSLNNQTRSFKQFFKEFIQAITCIQPYLYLPSQNHFTTDTKKKLIIVISTDKGLIGNLNSKLFAVINSSYDYRKDTVDLITIGIKGEEYFRKSQRNILKSFPIKDKITVSYLVDLYQYLSNYLHLHTYSKIKIYFNHCKNAFSVSPARLTLFPLSEETLKHFLHEINIQYPEGKSIPKLIIEPDLKTYTESIIQYIIENLIYYCILDSKTSENTARLSLMKLANQNSEKRKKSLIRAYNKARQTKITEELR